MPIFTFWRLLILITLKINSRLTFQSSPKFPFSVSKNVNKIIFCNWKIISFYIIHFILPSLARGQSESKFFRRSFQQRRKLWSYFFERKEQIEEKTNDRRRRRYFCNFFMYFVFEASTGTLRALGAESGTVDGLKSSLFNQTKVPPERQILLDEQGKNKKLATKSQNSKKS